MNGMIYAALRMMGCSKADDSTVCMKEGRYGRKPREMQGHTVQLLKNTAPSIEAARWGGGEKKKEIKRRGGSCSEGGRGLSRVSI